MAESKATQQDVTAGLLNADWYPRRLPDGTETAVIPLRTDDGAATSGVLYRNGRPKTVVCIMHPREFLAHHYLVPDLVEAGYAAWSQAPRSPGNDLRLEHERALLDVAAGLSHLRWLGFERIVLLGNSGGASLYTFYNQQALLAPGRRLERTPGGRPSGLAPASMPVPDGFVYVSAHPGQGVLVQHCIDPSVTDEADPLSVDASLDPFNPDNGFAEPPRSSSYAPDFLARYAEAQRARVVRLDEMAHELIRTRLAARKRSKESGDSAERRRGAHTPVMTVWRTDADPRCFDLGLDPSDRRYGSVWGRDPLASNYGCVGFARFCTPESWLSTWSGLSSNARMAATAPSVEQPALVLEYTGDNTVFPGDTTAIFEALSSGDKQRQAIRGDHHGRALTDAEEPGRYQAGRAVQAWLQEKFPPR